MTVRSSRVTMSSALINYYFGYCYEQTHFSVACNTNKRRQFPVISYLPCVPHLFISSHLTHPFLRQPPAFLWCPTTSHSPPLTLHLRPRPATGTHRNAYPSSLHRHTEDREITKSFVRHVCFEAAGQGRSSSPCQACQQANTDL